MSASSKKVSVPEQFIYGSGQVGLCAFVACSNIPGVFIALVLPAFLGRISKRNLCLFGAALMLLA